MVVEPWLAAAALGVLGLMIGSFLNVVIWRLPRMMEADWRRECAQLHATDQPDPPSDVHASVPPGPTFNLWQPASHCPHCQRPLRWRDNIPLLGYLVLGGRCAQCKAPISLRYPLVEVACALVFAHCGWRYGLNVQALAWCGFGAALLTLAMIDLDTSLLPDAITQPLVWFGLVLAAVGVTGTPLLAALWGAVAGYLVLWSVYWAFKILTKKEGMGYGDFKLLGAMGAWLGAAAIVPLILISSIVGALTGLAMMALRRVDRGQPIPFGPYLAAAGLSVHVLGAASIARWLGLP